MKEIITDICIINTVTNLSGFLPEISWEEVVEEIIIYIPSEIANLRFETKWQIRSLLLRAIFELPSFQ